MASKNDYFKKVGRATATTLSSPGYTTGDTSINIGATTNWPTDTGVTFAIDEVGSDGKRISGTYNVFNGKVSGAGQVSEVEYVGGDPNRNYSAGATTRVYILVSAYRDNKFTDGILVQHDQDGTHKDITADSITTGPISVTENIDVVDGKSIRDGNDNELITFSQTASAVNELTVKNAATGNAPQIQATGGDTNVGLNLVPKGTGEVQIGGTPISGAWQSWTPTWTNLTVGNGTVVAKYKQVGKTVTCKIYVLFGTGTSVSGTSSVRFTLPVSAAADLAPFASLGVANLTDQGVADYMCTLGYVDANSVIILPYAANGTYVTAIFMTSTVPFTMGNTDKIHGTFTYEAA